MTPSQFALVRVAKKQLGLDEDTYRAILKTHGGVQSTKDLDAAGFEAVMRHFNKCGFESTWRKRNFGERPGMASPRQVELIRQLWIEYTGKSDEAGLNAWLDRTTKASALRFLTASAAQKSITGLKKMIARRAAAQTDG